MKDSGISWLRQGNGTLCLFAWNNWEHIHIILYICQRYTPEKQTWNSAPSRPHWSNNELCEVPRFPCNGREKMLSSSYLYVLLGSVASMFIFIELQWERCTWKTVQTNGKKHERYDMQASKQRVGINCTYLWRWNEEKHTSQELWRKESSSAGHIFYSSANIDIKCFTSNTCRPVKFYHINFVFSALCYYW